MSLEHIYIYLIKYVIHVIFQDCYGGSVVERHPITLLKTVL